MFLTDTEIHELVKQHVIRGVDTSHVAGSKHDPVQAASVDLTIGGILNPAARESKRGAVGHPLGELSLKPGQTAVIETQQTCHLPADIGAIGFPPASVSADGLLTTNPGHVDPGYCGKLSFTVINMGKEPYPLKRGGKIVSLMLFRLPAPASSPYGERHGVGPHGAVRAERLAKLSHDFLDVDDRARKAAEGAELRTRLWGLAVPLLVAVVSVVGLYFTTISANREDVSELKQQVKVLESKLDVSALDARIKKLEDTP